MREIKNKTFCEERALFGQEELKVTGSVFGVGESPVKECKHIELDGCTFNWKYPVWYCRGVRAVNCIFSEGARAGVWYTDDMTVKDSVIRSPKNFRRCSGLSLCGVEFSDAKETLWSCSGVTLNKVSVRGDYFAMNCSDVVAAGLEIDGNYCFDGVKNLRIDNSRLITKDAFWNSENVTVYDSYISGEYLGWNSKNMTLVNCTVESLQGLCYIDGLTLKNCRLVNTTLALEYSTVEAQIDGRVESIFNPASGVICADEIGELFIEKDKVDPGKIKIICNNLKKRTESAPW